MMMFNGAEELLPLDYENISSDAEVPEVYRSEGANFSQYNIVFGNNFRSRMSGRIALAFRAKAALFSCQPGILQKVAKEHGQKLLTIMVKSWI